MAKEQIQSQGDYFEKGQVSSIPPRGPSTTSSNPGGASPASPPPPPPPKAPAK